MSDSQTLIVRTSTGLVEDIAVGAPADVRPPDGREAVLRAGPAADACVGWTRQANGSFTAPSYGPVESLADYAARRRYEIETGGIVMKNGAPIKTDRESQGLIDRAVALAEKDPDAAISFKTSAGFVTVDAPTMLAIGIAVGRHVRDSFGREKAAAVAIAAGTANTIAAVEAIIVGA